MPPTGGTAVTPKSSRPYTFDVTSLNLFEHCRFLRYVGKGIMMLIVGSLIALATTSVLTLALFPRATDAPVYYFLAVIYLATIFMICWCYWRTMMDDPGLVTEYDPFRAHVGDTTGPSAGDPLDDLCSRINVDATFRMRVTNNYTETLRTDMMRAAKSQHTARDKRLALAYAYETRPRWCKKCNRWKPPRSHHCSVMGTCVLKMDHYCVWMGNTIGLLNYKSFVLFLFWTFVGCALSAVLLFKPSVRFIRGETGALGPTASVERVVGGILGFIAFVFTAAFTAALIGFLIMHGSLIARNMTTIEAYEKRKVEPWPWNTGSWRENASQVFGGSGGSLPGLRRWIWILTPAVNPADRGRLVGSNGYVKLTVNPVEFFERAGLLDVV